MSTRFWEPIALVLSGVWLAGLTCLGTTYLFSLQDELRKPPQQAPVVAWIDARTELLSDSTTLPLQGSAVIKISPPLDKPFRVPYQFFVSSNPDTPGTAERIIPPGAETATIYFQLPSGSDSYADQTVTLTLLDGQEFTLTDEPTRQLTFPGRPIFATISASPSTLREGFEDESQIAIRLDAAAPRELQFSCDVTGDAIASGCYGADGPVRFVVLAGAQTSNVWTIRRRQPLKDTDRTLTLRVNAQDKVKLRSSELTVLCQAQIVPEVSVAFDVAEVQEGQSTRLTARLIKGQLDHALKITCRLREGAARPDDLTVDGGLPLVLTLQPNQISVSTAVTAVADRIAMEGTETSDWDIAAAGNVRLANSRATLRIVDRAPSVTVELRRSGDGILTEKVDQRSADITATLADSQIAGSDVLIAAEIDRDSTASVGPMGDVAISGFKSPQRTGQLVVPRDQGTGTMTVTVIDDALVQEGTEVLTLRFLAAPNVKLSAGPGFQLDAATGSVTTTFRIEDGDLLRVLPLKTINPIPEDGPPAKDGVRIAMLEGESPMAMKFKYQVMASSTAIYGQDYTIDGTDAERLEGTLTVPAKAQFVTVPLKAIADREFEPDETVVLKFSHPLFDAEVTLPIQDSILSGDVALLIPASPEFYRRRQELPAAFKKLADSPQLARLVGQGAVIVSPAAGNLPVLTKWDLKQEFPVLPAERLFSAKDGIEPQLTATFHVLDLLRKKSGDRPLKVIVVWKSDSAPTVVRLLGAPAAEKQELYVEWLGGRRFGENRYSETLEQALSGFARPPFPHAVRYMENEEEMVDDVLEAILKHRPTAP